MAPGRSLTRRQAARAAILRTASVYAALLIAAIVCAKLELLGLLPMLIGSTVTVGLVGLIASWMSWESNYLDDRPEYGGED